MISYSCRNRISFIYEDYYFENRLFKTILNPLLTKEFNTKENSLIDSNHIGNCNLKSYLELTYPKYSEFKNQFGLNVVISLYLELLTIKYVDMQFLLAVTALETILNGYAEMRQETGNPTTRSILRRNKKKTIEILENYDINNNEIACKIAEKISNPSLNIHDKLNDFINDDDFQVELNEFDRDFIFIRNKIAHTGKFPKKIRYNGTEREISLGEEFNRLIYLLDRIILTILKYKEKPFYDKLGQTETTL